jgi:endoglucanase
MIQKYFIGLLCALIGGALIIAVVLSRQAQGDYPVYSAKRIQLELWGNYKRTYIETASGRTFAPGAGNNASSSKGEALTMLQAVWMDDQPAFDASWQWTKDNLQDQQTHRIGALFGKKSDGSYGLLTDQGGNQQDVAAEQDIAVALSLAYSRWNQTKYVYDSLPLIQALWDQQVVTTENARYITSAPRTEDGTAHIVDTSVIKPYALKKFAAIDEAHDWNALVNDSYAILQRSLTANVSSHGVGAIPASVSIETDGTVQLAPQSSRKGYTSLQSGEALFGLGLDWQWDHDPRASELLRQNSLLGKQWQSSRELVSEYGPLGEALPGSHTQPSVYATALSYFMIADPKSGSDIYRTRLMTVYNPDTQSLLDPINYIEDAWVWMGISLYNHDLTDTTRS